MSTRGTDLVLDILESYRFDDRDEQTIREEWIFPLLSLLGYGATTLNEIKRNPTARLASPLRRLGSRRIEVDYVPTVLGHQLWIIEAKASIPNVDLDDHLSQAWSYATHPEIDVPLMVLADGRRIIVYDVTHVDWDRPVLDIARFELRSRFEELLSTLGARNVTRQAERRVLRHLAQVMKAQLRAESLDRIVEEVKKSRREAASSVADNARAILTDQEAREHALHQRVRDAAGVWGLAQEANRPWGGVSAAQAKEFVGMVENLPAATRLRELRSFVDACTPQRTPESSPRMFFPSRVLLFAGCLGLRTDPVCAEFAETVVASSLRDHLLAFPQDELARAAHRLELVLVPFVLRSYLSDGGARLQDAIRERSTVLDDESLLRHPLDADEALIRSTMLTCTAIWFRHEPWQVSSLNQFAQTLEELLPSLDFKRDGVRGPAGNPYLERWQRSDPLVEMTLVLAGEADPVPALDEDVLFRVERLAETNDSLVKQWAQNLLDRRPS
ncbi:MAG TPA: hypothetical protein VIG64_11985 [Actinomycetota bacterium]|jgi:hypothetical protein